MVKSGFTLSSPATTRELDRILAVKDINIAQADKAYLVSGQLRMTGILSSFGQDI